MAQGRKNSEISILTNKQESFVNEYLRNGGNSAGAYMHAYDSNSQNSAYQNGAALANDPRIKARIIELRELYNNAIQIDPKQYLTTQLLSIVSCDVFDIIDNNGQLKNIDDIDPNKRKAIKGIDITHVIDKDGNNRTTYKISLIDKVPIYEKLAKAIGYYEEHQKSRYKSTLSQAGKGIGTGDQGSGKINNAIQNNFINMDTAQLEKILADQDGNQAGNQVTR